MELPVFVQQLLVFIAGMFSACTSIGVLQSLGHKVFPIDIDPTNQDALRAVPVFYIMLVELSYALGSFAGGFIVGILSTAAAEWNSIAIALGVVLTLFGFANVFSFWHPLWFIVLSTITYIPACYYGAKEGHKYNVW